MCVTIKVTDRFPEVLIMFRMGCLGGHGRDIFYVCIVGVLYLGGAHMMCGVVCFYWGLHAYY